jgi:hypothetical protein
MKISALGSTRLVPLVLGVVLGAVAMVVYLFGGRTPPGGWLAPLSQGVELREHKVAPAGEASWPPPEYFEKCNWYHIAIDESGWSVGTLGTYQDVDLAIKNIARPEQELVIPILPSVYHPVNIDKLFYDALLDSDIAPGDKVLVIGTGSGVDAWVASRKCQTPVHIVEINPMAVLNARLTAAVGGFEIKPVVGDIRQVELPEDFRDFDWVLWNMPFVEAEATMDYLQGRNFHDGDNGVILTEFLAMLPKLLKPDGTAILLNHAIAEKYIDLPGVTTKVADDAGEITDTTFMLFVVPNPAGR